MQTLRKSLWLVAAALCCWGADLEGSKDPPGMKRYAGSEIIGYREPKFGEMTLPLGPPKDLHPPVYEKSLKVEGRVTRCTYMAPPARTPSELFRNYKLEFQRLGITTLYEKDAGVRGWFGPTFDQIAEEDRLAQILGYNEAQERVLVGKSKASKPTYYYVFVTAYNDGIIPAALEGKLAKGQPLVQVVVIEPEALADNMAFVNAEEMTKALGAVGSVAIYGIYFDTNQDTMLAKSAPAVEEMVKLLRSQPELKVRVVGHTDNQGDAAFNLDLSKRRAASVVRELVTKHGIAAKRLDSFGCGLYAPRATNETDAGRAENRRVELVTW